ncbi:MAG: TIGR04149 family rSAM-modified RiPP [Dysgonamonadaceae bacterium]|jgi:natural product precursor|nr:TIGR04149 family rSAM-modified RiPP [Dysgonamonadaceae bacterium]
MKKISLKRVSEILSDKELKNVLGGSDFALPPPFMSTCHCPGVGDCVGFCAPIFYTNNIGTQNVPIVVTRVEEFDCVNVNGECKCVRR